MVAEGLATAIAFWVAAGDEGGSLSATVISLAFGGFCEARDEILKTAWEV